MFPEMDFVSIYRSRFSEVALKTFKLRPKFTNGIDYVIQMLQVLQDSSSIDAAPCELRPSSQIQVCPLTAWHYIKTFSPKRR
jgi:hypothetical protein